ncbi:MAG: tautomerase family protein [Deltaproteobacteria bacterium]|nr:MAG: tautomerase family protein [Deltaproteobacteria bacterium]
MPNITIEGPPIKELDKKRRFARELTEAAVKAYGLPKEAIIVLLKENSPENVSVGGELIVDRHQKSDKSS